MDFHEYQIASARTIPNDPGAPEKMIFALGLAGEAGEVAEIFKKHFGHAVPLDLAALIEELGDLLWYAAAIATAYDVSLEHIAELNVAKLRRRYPAGFVTGGGNREKKPNANA